MLIWTGAGPVLMIRVRRRRNVRRLRPSYTTAAESGSGFPEVDAECPVILTIAAEIDRILVEIIRRCIVSKIQSDKSTAQGISKGMQKATASMQSDTKVEKASSTTVAGNLNAAQTIDAIGSAADLFSSAFSRDAGYLDTIAETFEHTDRQIQESIKAG